MGNTGANKKRGQSENTSALKVARTAAKKVKADDPEGLASLKELARTAGLLKCVMLVNIFVQMRNHLFSLTFVMMAV